MKYRGTLEYAHARQLRARNKQHYRLAHWPIWIAVFFLAPGVSTAALFDHGFGWGNALWLFIVVAGTGAAGVSGKLPGAEHEPYILRFDEDRPNPLYRRVCYTFAWNAVLNFTLLNLAGLILAAATGHGYMPQLYHYAYLPLCVCILMLGLAGVLPRAGTSTRREGTERRYFYGSVWTVTLAQVLLLVAWKLDLPEQIANHAKLLVFVATLIVTAFAAAHGVLPRTRPIVAGECMVLD